MLWLLYIAVFLKICIEQTVSEDKQLEHCKHNVSLSNQPELHDVSSFRILLLSLYVKDKNFHFHRNALELQFRKEKLVHKLSHDLQQSTSDTDI